MVRTISIFLVILLVSSTAFAARLGTGGPTGNYYAMGQDIATFCGEGLDQPLEVLESKGSVDNITGMTKKAYSMGIVQEDVMQYYNRNNPRKFNGNSMKIVSGLHLETIYLLIPKGWAPESEEKSWFEKAAALAGGGDEAIGPMNFNALQGQTVIAPGGAQISAQALMHFTGVVFNTVESGNKLPILMVGGNPYAPVEDLLKSGKYNLVSLDADSLQAKAPFYVKTVINYTVGGKNFQATTVGVQAMLIGKASNRKERNADMVSLAKCISDSLPDLADDFETNANWQSALDMVEEGPTNWQYFSID